MMYEREHGPGSPFLASHPSSPVPGSPVPYPYSDHYAQQPQQPFGDTYTPTGSQAGSFHDYADPDSAYYPPVSPRSAHFQQGPTLLAGAGGSNGAVSRSYGSYGAAVTGAAKGKRGGMRKWGILAAVVIVAAAVVVPVYFFVIRKMGNGDAATEGATSTSGSSNSGGSSSGGKKPAVGIVTGGDGSTVVAESGESFVYNNSFGGYWLADASNPFASGARPNSWTPPLNESWTWGKDRVYGVNLGGWFVLEPFISPALFQAYPAAADEWDLSTAMRADGTLEATMEKHYAEFITEKDIAQIAGAGLNWVRVPIPFWAVSTWADVGRAGDGSVVSEPFLEGVCWKYIVRLLGWARKYGLRVNLDLHSVPGSQNGYNHSGKLGQVNFLNGPMGVANAQRALDVIRIISEFIAQPEYQDVVGMFGIVNEALMQVIGRPVITSFYLEAHRTIREITGLGAGKGPYVSIHDGFGGVSTWAGFLEGSDRIILDTHPYFSFGGGPNDEPIATSEDPAQAGGPWPQKACSSWGPGVDKSRSAFGVTVAGEFSNGYNDCGMYLTGVNGTAHYPDCTMWEDASMWNASAKAGVMEFARASMDAFGDWFFWTWKIGPALDGVVRAPLWSYQAGLEGGWMPTDPRSATGKCAQFNVQVSSFGGQFKPWQTGGDGAGTIAATSTQQFGQWPPTSLSTGGPVYPTYTPTGSVATLSYVTPTPTGSVMASATVSIGNGWANPADTAGGVTAIAGCTYPNAWGAVSLPAPTGMC